MFRNRLLKILALLMVLNILIIPLTSFTPQQQNKYKVYAAEGVVDIRFYNAMVSLIGITAAGIAAMSPSFSIPEVDMVQLKDQFAQSLETDATKKAAWMTAQTEYLAGGVAKTMGAVELAKIGLNDIYNDFLNYLKSKYPVNTSETSVIIDGITFDQTIYNAGLINSLNPNTIYTTIGYENIAFFKPANVSANNGINYSLTAKLSGNVLSRLECYYDSSINRVCFKLSGSFTSYTNNAKLYYKQILYQFGLLSKFEDALSVPSTTGAIDYTGSADLVNSTDSTRSIIPTIPWIDTNIPVGTIVTPEISAPYAGTVPIDVPITAPIDPPIEEPVDPPVEENIAGTVAAILAGLTPIAGFLEYILAGQVSLTDTIEAGITGVIDGIGDIAGTLTGGITSSLTDIQSSISTLFDPPTETLNLDKLKNLNSVLFTKFPFSIPFDFVSMISAFSSDPVAPVITIPFDMSDFGGQFTEVKMDLSDYNNIAAVARQIGFIGFVFFMLFNTRKLIWK